MAHYPKLERFTTMEEVDRYFTKIPYLALSATNFVMRCISTSPVPMT